MENAHSVPHLSDLVDQHYALLYRYAYRLTGCEADAEDLTQQAFLAAQKNLSQLREPERAKSWLCAILRNVYLKDCRSQRALPTKPLETVPEPSASLPFESPVDGEQLQNILNELPEEYRSVIVLFYFGELSYKEIAEQMGVPIGTVMSRLARGKAHLRRRLVPCPTTP